MDNNSRAREKLLKHYRTVATVFLNTILLLVLVNLLIAGVFALKGEPKQGSANPGIPFRHKEYHTSLSSVYPDLSPKEVTQLIRETRQVPEVYEPYTQFREPLYKSKYVNVDSGGFRITKNQGPWPPFKDYYTVFMFGGSTTFGYGVTDSETIASYLQELLSKNAGLNAAVYNFGRCAYISCQERVLLEKLILDGFVPDLALFLDGLNDFVHWKGEPGYTTNLRKFMAEGEVPLGRRILRELPITKAFLSYTGGTVHRTENDSGDKTRLGPKDEFQLLNQVIDRYRTNKRIIECVCAGFGIVPVFVWQPIPLYHYEMRYHVFAGFNYPDFTPYVRPGYELMAQVVRSEPFGPDFIWAADVQKDLKEPLYVDAFHYSAKMSRIIAEYIVASMIERKLVP